MKNCHTKKKRKPVDFRLRSPVISENVSAKKCHFSSVARVGSGLTFLPVVKRTNTPYYLDKRRCRREHGFFWVVNVVGGTIFLGGGRGYDHC